jgi:hypothetical protein
VTEGFDGFGDLGGGFLGHDYLRDGSAARAVDGAGGGGAGVKNALLQRGEESWVIRVENCLRHGCAAFAIILLNSLSTLALKSASIQQTSVN